MVRERISYFSDLPSCFYFYNRSLLELIYEDLEKLKQYVIKLEKLKAFLVMFMYVMGFIFIQRKTFTNYIMYVTYCNKCMRIYRSNNIFNFTISFLATTQYNTFRSTFVYDPTAFKKVAPRSISDKILAAISSFYLR